MKHPPQSQRAVFFWRFDDTGVSSEFVHEMQGFQLPIRVLFAIES